ALFDDVLGHAVAHQPDTHEAYAIQSHAVLLDDSAEIMRFQAARHRQCAIAARSKFRRARNCADMRPFEGAATGCDGCNDESSPDCTGPSSRAFRGAGHLALQFDFDEL